MTEVALVLKASVILALGLVAARAAVRAKASLRHLWLAATLAALAALPVVILTAPEVAISLPAKYAAIGLAPAQQPAAAIDRAGAAANERRPDHAGIAARGGWTAPSWLTLARWGWAAGTAAILASLIVSLVRVRRIRRSGVPLPALCELTRTLARDAGIRVPVEILEHEDIAAPFTCGLWRPAIVLPSDVHEWDETAVRRAIVHELEHVRRGDWAVQLAARAVCAGYWFHPLVWTAWRGLCLEAERACDDAVVKAADRADYADQLVLLARRLSGAPPRAMLGMANRSDLSARVTAVLDDRQRRGRAGALAAATVVMAVALVLSAIAPVRAVPASQTAQTYSFLTQDGTTRQFTLVAREPKTRRGGPLDRALFEAAAEGDLETIDKLLQVGANVNAAIDGDGSPLIAAAKAGQLAAVSRLLDRGADPNMPVPGDGAPLIAAAEEGQAATVALLLDRRANIELVVPGDENALIQASAHGHVDVVKLLIARGANVNARVWVDEGDPRRPGEWRTPLTAARKARHDAVAALLIAAGARE